MSKEKWQRADNSDEYNEHYGFCRIKVPGGWVYRFLDSEFGAALTFVPTPTDVKQVSHHD